MGRKDFTIDNKDGEKSEFKEDTNCYKVVVKPTVELVTKQAEAGDIAGVVKFDDNTKYEKFVEVDH